LKKRKMGVSNFSVSAVVYFLLQCSGRFCTSSYSIIKVIITMKLVS